MLVFGQHHNSPPTISRTVLLSEALWLNQWAIWITQTISKRTVVLIVPHHSKMQGTPQQNCWYWSLENPSGHWGIYHTMYSRNLRRTISISSSLQSRTGAMSQNVMTVTEMIIISYKDNRSYMIRQKPGQSLTLPYRHTRENQENFQKTAQQAYQPSEDGQVISIIILKQSDHYIVNLTCFIFAALFTLLDSTTL